MTLGPPGVGFTQLNPPREDRARSRKSQDSSTRKGKQLFGTPLHPYTHGLLTSIPTLGTPKDQKLNVIPGMVPNPLSFPSGCKFHPRCPVAEERCKTEEPPLVEVKKNHWAACHLIKEGRSPVAT